MFKRTNIEPTLPSRQRGFTLIQISAALVISGIIATSTLEFNEASREKKEFQHLGNMMSEHSRAVAEWIVDQGGAAVPATYAGTNWLKSNADCGIVTGGSVAYLPCGFDFDNVPFGNDPTTVITNAAGVTVGNTTWPAITVGGIAKSVGVGYAVLQAESDSRDTLRGAVTYTENNSAVITASVDINNATSVYVRRSGDSMTGDLDMGANDLNNVGILSATTGSFSTVSATGNISGRDISASRNVLASSSVRAPRFYDSNNTGYYVDPASTSRLNTAYAARIYDLNNSGYYIDPASTSRLNSVHAARIYDVNNTGYYVDPASTNRLNYVDMNVGRTRSNYSVGGGCTTKMFGSTSTGEPLACVNGIWKSASASTSGTGIKGVFNPYSGRTVTCYSSMAGTVGYGRVLSTGQPQVRHAWGSWINGVYLSTTYSRKKIKLTLTTTGISGSIEIPGGGGDSASLYTCQGFWT